MPAYTVPAEAAGSRWDSWLHHVHDNVSRARIQEWIRAGHVRVDGQTVKPGQSVTPGAQVTVTPPAPVAARAEPEAIPLDIRYEDDALLVVNKPPGLVVHPAAGHAVGTLVNALLHHCTDLPGIGGEERPGIVHRLDKDTSGLLVVAKTESALTSLSRQFKARTVQKGYVALVQGDVAPPTGTIETAIGRDPHQRQRMRAAVAGGRMACTRYAVRTQCAEGAWLDVTIETGRTHQIRVHLAHIGHPVLGDSTYGRCRPLADGTVIPRQMLHAAILALQHPVTGIALEFNATIPDDMRQVWRALCPHSARQPEGTD